MARLGNLASGGDARLVQIGDFGYFANKESAQLATPLIADWVEIFEETVSDLTITYHSISLYGFTDMITFFKTKK